MTKKQTHHCTPSLTQQLNLISVPGGSNGEECSGVSREAVSSGVPPPSREAAGRTSTTMTMTMEMTTLMILIVSGSLVFLCDHKNQIKETPVLSDTGPTLWDPRSKSKPHIGERYERQSFTCCGSFWWRRGVSDT